MKRDSRLSDVLHVLLHMAHLGAEAAEGGAPQAFTSEALATAMGSHPVVVRRLMAGLRRAGLVASEKGHGGGWVLSCPLSAVTLGDIYEAVGAPGLLAVGNRREQPSCLVEQAVNAALGDAYREAEALLLGRFHAVPLSVLAEDFARRARAIGYSPAKSLKENWHGHTHE